MDDPLVRGIRTNQRQPSLYQNGKAPGSVTHRPRCGWTIGPWGTTDGSTASLAGCPVGGRYQMLSRSARANALACSSPVSDQVPCAIPGGSRATALISIMPYCPSGARSPRPPNLRQNAVLGGQTIHLSLVAAVALHRPAAMAVAGVGTLSNGRRCVPGHLRLMVPLRMRGGQLPCAFIHIATKATPDTSI